MFHSSCDSCDSHVLPCTTESKLRIMQEFLGSLWGDKDTFGLAFAVAGKAEQFTQVTVPPGELLLEA